MRDLLLVKLPLYVKEKLIKESRGTSLSLGGTNTLSSSQQLYAKKEISLNFLRAASSSDVFKRSLKN